MGSNRTVVLITEEKLEFKTPPGILRAFVYSQTEWWIMMDDGVTVMKIHTSVPCDIEAQLHLNKALWNKLAEIAAAECREN